LAGKPIIVSTIPTSVGIGMVSAPFAAGIRR